MKRIVRALLALFLLPLLAWLAFDGSIPPLTWFGFRDPLVQLTGVLGIVAMSASMILAARPSWLERPLHGLDKMYRLHKWLGIGGSSLSATWPWSSTP